MNDQLFVSSHSNSEKELETESFIYQSISLSSITPDDIYARFFPVKFIEDEDARLFTARKITTSQLTTKYDAGGCVLIGQSCIVNCLEYGTSDWKKASRIIDSILEITNNISASEVTPVPTIYPIADSKFQILTGHKRFFALVYVEGYGSTAEFKLYNSKPMLTKVKHFREISRKEGYPQYKKLIVFISAMIEVDTLNNARLKAELEKHTIVETATVLGLSVTDYESYNALIRYPCVIDAYESGFRDSFAKTKKIVLETESDYMEKHDKSVLNLMDNRFINNEIKTKLLDKKQANETTRVFEIKPVVSSDAIKTLLSTNVLELDVGVDWKNMDWKDRVLVSESIAKVIDILESKTN